MRKYIILGVVLSLFMSVSCARKAANLETGILASKRISSDLAPQIDYALETISNSSSRKTRLLKAREKLQEYNFAYSECVNAVVKWQNTGQAPENTAELYETMWDLLLQAQTLAAQEYIYVSECAATTSLKGKSCPGG